MSLEDEKEEVNDKAKDDDSKKNDFQDEKQSKEKVDDSEDEKVVDKAKDKDSKKKVKVKQSKEDMDDDANNEDSKENDCQVKVKKKIPDIRKNSALSGLMGLANMCYAKRDLDSAERMALSVIENNQSFPEPFELLTLIYGDQSDKDKVR